MPFLTTLAVYFVIWWLTLFIVLPIGMRSQQDEGDVLPGTVASAPAKFRGVRVVLLTSLLAALIHGGWMLVSHIFGISVSSLPVIVPDFG
ncbi:DUF1467 family protein [Neorhizobium sp. NPDC001467]|uniref:DUF1467 family protein n=1 Tax=Neorhizobium sp. NPDC001467 TaxID=3390595 RepID=UPI003CFBC58A